VLLARKNENVEIKLFCFPKEKEERKSQRKWLWGD